MSSNKVVGADNQQERPGFEQWIVGFVDGEGCFSAPLYKNHKTRMGWQVQPSFAVVQGTRSVHVLYELKQYFGCGGVYINHRHDNHREHLYRYDVRRLDDLVNRIVPFFEANPLRTAKREDFQRFAAIIKMMQQRVHLTRGRYDANCADRSGNESPKAVTIPGILRGHTPANPSRLG
jgi:hypothetical protein